MLGVSPEDGKSIRFPPGDTPFFMICIQNLMCNHIFTLTHYSAIIYDINQMRLHLCDGRFLPLWVRTIEEDADIEWCTGNDKMP